MLIKKIIISLIFLGLIITIFQANIWINPDTDIQEEMMGLTLYNAKVPFSWWLVFIVEYKLY